MPSAFIAAFRSKRVALSIPLGFVAGLGLTMRGSTLSAWITDVGLDIKTIAMFTWAGLFFTFKPLWAPVVDRYRIPLLGRRRGWMLVCQLAIAASIMAMGLIDPHKEILTLAGLAAVTSFLVATQDIASDAYRVDLLAANERASASAMYTLGYRAASIVAAAGALFLADRNVSWSTIYFLMGALMGVGVLATWFGPEPEAPAGPRTMRAAVVEPLKDFFSRPGSVAAISFVLLYKFGDYMAADLTTTFLMKVGFSKTTIAANLKVIGMIATILGSIMGGGLVGVMGVRRSLLIFGVLQALMNTGYLALAIYGQHYVLMVAAISADWFCGGMASAAFAAYQLSLCSRQFSATQYAIIASASALLGRFVGGFNGFIIDAIGWRGFFIVTMVVAIPGLCLIVFGRIERASIGSAPAAPVVPPPAAPPPSPATAVS
jgi:PAT family beta-lactamase induction signal transducer AmpG